MQILPIQMSPQKQKRSKKEDRSSKERRLKEAKKVLKKALKSKAASGPPVDTTPLDASSQIQELSSADYYQRNPEFSTWLREERGRFFNELSAEGSRALFDEFALVWNQRKLPARYYTGLAAEAATMRRTGFQWGVRTGGDALDTGAVGMAAVMEDEREAQAARRAGQQVERKAWKTEQKELMHEMLPKATGREAQIEQRIARREAAKERDQSPELLKLPGGGDIMGGDDSFSSAQASDLGTKVYFGTTQAKVPFGKLHSRHQAAASGNEAACKDSTLAP
eukprot:jgi/Astpho2/3603/Aster-x1157